MYNPYIFNPLWFYPIPDLNLEPPTIYSLLESIVNYGKDEKTKIKDLASVGRTEIFDFDYPLTSSIDRAYFETQILNHYLMRRIGFETLTAFKLQLNCKLNEIMPIYNKMFESIENLDIFGPEIITRVGTDYTARESLENSSTTLENSSNTLNTGTQDLRKSDTPQSNLNDVQDGTYVTEYNYNTNRAESTDNSNSKGTNKSTSNSNDNKNYNETVTRSLTGADKLKAFQELQSNLVSIFKLIYKDLDCLFYGLVY